MSKKIKAAPAEKDSEIIDLYDEEITDEDYGFVLGPDGELKSVFVPEDYTEMPKKIKAIFKVLGITDPENIHVHTVH